MKLVIAALLLGSLVAGSTEAQSSQSTFGTPATGTGPSTEIGYPSWDQARVGHYRRTLESLRKEALRLRATDGGRLTAAHTGYLQGRIDAAERELAYETSGRVVPIGSNAAPR